MKDQNKIQTQLIHELMELRQRTTELLKTRNELEQRVIDLTSQLAQKMEEGRQAEEALRQSEELYRQLFEMESDALFLIDNQTGQILEANHAASLLYGYNHQELLSMKNTDLSAEPEETQRITQGTPVMVDNVVTIPLRWHRKKDSAVFPIEVTGRFFQRKGRSVHVAAMRDITERKQMMEDLKKSEALLKDTQQISNVGGWEYVVETGKTTWTDQVYRIYGVSPKKYDPNNIMQDIEYYAPEERTVIEKAFKNAVKEGKSYDLELKFTNAHGKHLWVRTIGQPELKEGNVVRVFGNIMDISERKQAEAEREKLIQELQKSLEKVKLLSGMFPICSSCKKIRDDKGYWKQIEVYIRDHSEAEFTHGICPECFKKLYPDFDDEEQ